MICRPLQIREHTGINLRNSFPVANARYRFSSLNWVIVLDRCNNVPGHAISHNVRVILLPWGRGESSIVNWPIFALHGSRKCHLSRWRFKCKLAGRRKGGHRLERKARWAPKHGTNGSIWKGKRAERKRRFPSWAGAEKIAADSNFRKKKKRFLVRRVQDPCQIAMTSLYCTSSDEGSYSGYAMKPKIH